MTDKISLIETKDLERKIQVVTRQTDYAEDVAREKLQEFDYDELKVIRFYLGITEEKKQPIKSVNQEIYKQLRYRLDENARDYTKRKENGETKNL